MQVVLGFSAKSWFLIEVNDLLSKSLFVFRLYYQNMRLHTKVQPFSSIFRTKYSLYKMYCPKVWDWARHILNISWNYFHKLEQNMWLLFYTKVDITLSTYAPFDFMTFIHCIRLSQANKNSLMYLFVCLPNIHNIYFYDRPLTLQLLAINSSSVDPKHCRMHYCPEGQAYVLCCDKGFTSCLKINL